MKSIIYGDMDNISISRRESQLINQVVLRDMVIFTPRDVRRFLGTTPENANRIIQNMMNKGTIARVERGKYLLRETLKDLDIYEIVSDLFRPSYISFWSAMHIHSMTEQVPRTIFVVTTRRKRSLSFQGQRIRYITFAEPMFFGYQRIGKIVVSDPEKTIIDSLRYPEYSGGIPRIYQALSFDLDPEKLVEYCRMTKGSSIASRLGYLMEKRGFDFRSKELRKMITTYTKLDPNLKGSNPSAEWKLYVNGEIT